MPILAMESSSRELKPSNELVTLNTEYPSLDNSKSNIFWNSIKTSNGYKELNEDYNKKAHVDFMQNFATNLFEDYLTIYLEASKNQNKSIFEFFYGEFVTLDENQSHLLMPKIKNKSSLNETNNEFRINIFTGIILMLVNSSNDLSKFASQYFITHFLSEVVEDTFKNEIEQYKTLLQSELTYEVLQYKIDTDDTILLSLCNTLYIFDKMLRFVDKSDTITIIPQDPFFLSILSIFKKLLILQQWNIKDYIEEIKKIISLNECTFTFSAIEEYENNTFFIKKSGSEYKLFDLMKELTSELSNVFDPNKVKCTKKSFILTFIMSINNVYEKIQLNNNNNNTTTSNKNLIKISLVNKILFVYYFLLKNKEYYNFLNTEINKNKQLKNELHEETFIDLGHHLLDAIFLTTQNVKNITNIKDLNDQTNQSESIKNIINFKKNLVSSDFEEYVYSLERNFILTLKRDSLVYMNRLHMARSTKDEIKKFISTNDTINSIFAKTFFEYRPFGTNFIHILTTNLDSAKKIEGKVRNLNPSNKLVLDSFFIWKEDMMCYRHPSFIFELMSFKKSQPIEEFKKRKEEMSAFSKIFSCFSNNTKKQSITKRVEEGKTKGAFETNQNDIKCIREGACPKHISNKGDRAECKNCELYTGADLNPLFFACLQIDESKTNEEITKDYNKSITDYSFLYYHNMLKASKGKALINYHALRMHLLTPAAKDFFTLDDAFQHMIPKIDQDISKKNYQNKLINHIKQNPYLYNRDNKVSEANIEKITKNHQSLYEKLKIEDGEMCDSSHYIYENVCYLLITFLQTGLQDLLIYSEHSTEK